MWIATARAISRPANVPLGGLSVRSGSSTRPGKDRAVTVFVGDRPTGGHQAVLERVLAVARRDDDRHAPVVELPLPAIDAGDDALVGVPDLDREDLDPRIDGDRQGRERELEPRAPRLRVEDAVVRAGPGRAGRP